MVIRAILQIFPTSGTLTNPSWYVDGLKWCGRCWSYSRLGRPSSADSNAERVGWRFCFVFHGITFCVVPSDELSDCPCTSKVSRRHGRHCVRWLVPGSWYTCAILACIRVYTERGDSRQIRSLLASFVLEVLEAFLKLVVVVRHSYHMRADLPCSVTNTIFATGIFSKRRLLDSMWVARRRTFNKVAVAIKTLSYRPFQDELRCFCWQCLQVLAYETAPQLMAAFSLQFVRSVRSC